MKIIKRPIQNIKQADWGVVIWMSAWTSLIALWVIPAQAYTSVGESISFLFSLDFYSAPTVSENILTNMQNKTTNLLNIGKVVFWFMTMALLFMFLFKKPKLK
ncbi:hypothetical protein ACQVQ3_24475 [Bacillus cereus]|uniref:hypothetical protein n=1 Tax=Bacillus cereus TaxID=1396 RepID=UPI003D6604E6